MKHVRFVVASSLLALFALCSSCMEEKIPEVHFILPNDFKGNFSLIVDPSKGEEISMDHGKTIYKVNGNELYIQSEPPSFTRVRITAEFESGTKLPMAYSLNMYPDETLALFGPNHDESLPSRYTFVVTTVREMKQKLGRGR